MNSLYPLKFEPIFKEKIWGGNRMKSLMPAEYDPPALCGEAWVLSGVGGSTSTVSNGFLAGNDLNEILEVYMYDLVGDAVYEKYGNEFPVLVKLIDANDWLSIQVHPDDELAARRESGRGKTEMWYVLQAGENAQLISGFNKKINREQYQLHLRDGSLPGIMNYEAVNKGDVFFIPAGRVHALGPGILLAEIQETSDTTYRIYDWDRTDSQGKSRDLHIEQALDAIDFAVHEKYRTDYPAAENKSVRLAACEHFTTNLITLNTYGMEKDYGSIDSFVALLCVDGEAKLLHRDGSDMLKTGELLLLPATCDQVSIHPHPRTRLLEIFI
jgi:mannose-6-phosphate isomerase